MSCLFTLEEGPGVCLNVLGSLNSELTPVVWWGGFSSARLSGSPVSDGRRVAPDVKSDHRRPTICRSSYDHRLRGTHMEVEHGPLKTNSCRNRDTWSYEHLVE